MSSVQLSFSLFDIFIFMRNANKRRIIDRQAKLYVRTIMNDTIVSALLACYDESPRCIADIMHSVIIVDKWHPLLARVYGNLKH